MARIDNIIRMVGLLVALFVLCTCSKDNGIYDKYSTLEIIVKDDANDSLLDNVSLKLVETGVSATLKDNGLYEFTNLNRPEYDISASKAGYNDTILKKVKIEQTKQQITIRLKVIPSTTGDIKGKISPDNLQKFKGAFIMLVSTNSDKHYTETKSDRSFQFKGIPNGRYELFIYADGFIKKNSIPVTVPNNTEETYTLESYKGSINFNKPYIDMGPVTNRTTDVFAVHTPADNTWEIVYDKEKFNWITSIDPMNGKGEKSIRLTITREPDRLRKENNYAVLSIRSLTDASHDELLLTVTETGYGNLANLAMQEEKISITSSSATIPCEILNPDIVNKGYEVGVIYSSTNENPGQNDTREKATKIEGYSYSVQLNIKANTQYWAIAYAYDTSTKEYYWSDRIIQFTTNVKPSQAIIDGKSSNECPSNTVLLTANSNGSDKYKWYKNGNLIDGAESNVYIVTNTGTYSASGVNTQGEGIRSKEKYVTIEECPSLPTQAIIEGSDSNLCPSTNVILTANANDATGYKWYKDNVLLSSSGNKLSVTSSGTYYAVGVNSLGDGMKSTGKTVTISSCIPNAPTNVTAKMSGSDIKVSWNSVPFATSYKIRISGSSSSYSYYRTTNSTSYTFKESEGILFCNLNTFEVTAINASGEESREAGNASCNRNISLTTPDLKGNVITKVVDLSWRPSTGITTETIVYEIERSIDGGAWQLRTTTTGTSHSEALPSGKPFTEVYYRVRAKTSICNSTVYSDYNVFWTFIPF